MSGEHPDFLWRSPTPKSSYEVVIVGAGGHGLATAYYLPRNHGITDVAALEKGWLAGGNIARNTTVIRSNYLWDESAAIYEHSLKLWEGLEAELDYDLLFSQCGVLNLAHTLQDVRESVRRVGANRLNGIDAEWLDPAQVAEICPIVKVSPGAADALARGCALDLRPSVFPPGQCAQTLVARAQVILYRTDEHAFRLLVRPSFADYLLTWLRDAMAH